MSTKSPDLEQIAAGLRQSGYTDPLPAVGQQWVDTSITWLPGGHRHILTIEWLSPTVSGWQCRVARRQVDADGTTIGACGDGLMYLDTLLADGVLYEPPQPAEPVEAAQ